MGRALRQRHFRLRKNLRQHHQEEIKGWVERSETQRVQRTSNTHGPITPHYIFENVDRISEAPSDTVTYLSFGEYK